jgi:DNA-binding NarL/FixJ family response regulator
MDTAQRIRVLLVDDSALFRRTMRSLLVRYPDLEVVGEASDGSEAIEKVGRLQAEVVLMDVHLGRVIDGIAATRLLIHQFPGVAVLGLSCDSREYVAAGMRQAGALDVLAKEQTVEEVHEAIRRAAASMSDE